MTERAIQADPRCRTNEWGIDQAYEDALGEWHEASNSAVAAIAAAMGGGEQPPAVRQELIILLPGETRKLTGGGTLQLESGESLAIMGELPTDLPWGYHHWRSEDGQTARVIVSPGKCWLPEDLKTWGWSVQLYSVRSAHSWGMGDLRDLRELAEWSAGQGARMLLLNPLSAASPLPEQEPSPYFPSSRTFLNTLWLHVPEVACSNEAAMADLDPATLNALPLLDRKQVFAVKMRSLEQRWGCFFGSEDFDRFCAERAPDLERYALFCALTEHFASGWHSWPEEYRQPGTEAVQAFREDHSERVRFHQWIQWHLDRQLAKSAGTIGLMQDLPIGVNPDGADAWAWQDVFAQGMGVGAPPDEFNTQGQNWGLPPFNPHRLREAGYEPFIQTLRAAFRHCGGLRIDHVMGLFRLFWVPNGMSASEGAYVRYPADELLAILALESHRAKAYVVGEDLGTVEDYAREKLTAANILSYRVLWFEKDPPPSYPVNALAAVTTHDLPTIAGLWSGSDLERQRELGLNPNEASTAEIHQRVAKMIGDEGDTLPAVEVVQRVHALLGTAPCRLLVAVLDDALVVEERPNIPSTTPGQNPNWSRALPRTLEQIKTEPLAARIAASLNER